MQGIILSLQSGEGSGYADNPAGFPDTAAENLGCYSGAMRLNGRSGLVHWSSTTATCAKVRVVVAGAEDASFFDPGQGNSVNLV
jgi:hypothetical protein